VSQSVKFAKVFTYLALIVLLTVPLCAFTIADAESTRVFLDPSSQTVGAVGDSFIVNVKITDVSNLYGYGFKLYYNSTLMNGTQPVDEGSFLKSGGQTPFWGVVSFTDYYNSTHGYVWIYCTLTGNVSGIYGSGVLATMKFKSLASGDSVPLHLADVQLSEPYDRTIDQSPPIPCDVSDGTVTVVPEFTSTVALLSLIIVSLLGIFFGKRVMRKVPNFNS
jgi:hypothetical protein